MTTATHPTKRVYRCAICNRKLGDTYVFSQHTGARYCFDLTACDKRARRKVAAEPAPDDVPEPVEVPA